MNRNLSVKEVVALFEKFIGSLADDELEKIVGKPTKSKRQEKEEDLKMHIYKSNLPIEEAALEWMEKQLPLVNKTHGLINDEWLGGYRSALSDVRKNFGVE